ncbi:MAG: hypothetical protein HWQ41_19580 [Nostoc sp. NOS(2021)]|uniref:hypothetical protein n=1 Tax=Nostoc sp. NOS(2021) TaxID=2815407 RepID=UPI0025E4E603|nr:hypothetical protein [Nostoc sp. NOS(2021)]MBN3897397.1 hypothetical protein [Nostoc sp. NOS(2021)]
MTNTETKPIRPITVDMDLDLYGLDPYEFRIYGHIARRGDCYSNLKTMGAICNMSVRQAQYALKKLKDKNLITQKKRKGTTDLYQITDKSSWKQPDYNNKLDNALEYFNRALIRRELKDYQGAFQDFKKSVELFEEELLQLEKHSTRKEKDIQDARKELIKTKEKIN